MCQSGVKPGCRLLGQAGLMAEHTTRLCSGARHDVKDAMGCRRRGAKTGAAAYSMPRIFDGPAYRTLCESLRMPRLPSALSRKARAIETLFSDDQFLEFSSALQVSTRDRLTDSLALINKPFTVPI